MLQDLFKMMVHGADSPLKILNVAVCSSILIECGWGLAPHFCWIRSFVFHWVWALSSGRGKKRRNWNIYIYIQCCCHFGTNLSEFSFVPSDSVFFSRNSLHFWNRQSILLCRDGGEFKWLDLVWSLGSWRRGPALWSSTSWPPTPSRVAMLWDRVAFLESTPPHEFMQVAVCTL